LNLLSTAATGNNNPDQIASLSNDQVAALTVNQAKGASAAFFKAMAADDVAKLSDVAVSAITPKSLTTMTNFSGLSSDNLGLISSTQVTALTPAQVAAMSGSGDSNDIQYLPNSALAGLGKKNIININLEALTSDQFASLTADQLNAAALTAANITGITAITTEEIAALTPKQAAGLGTAFAAALDSTQISKLTPEAVAALLPKTFAALNGTTAGGLSGLSSENATLITSAQINALSSNQITSLITNEDIQYVLPAALAGLDKKNLPGFTHLVTNAHQVLTADQFAALKPSQVELLPNTAIIDITGADNIALLNAATFAVLSSSQVASIPATSISSVPPEAFAGLTAKTIVGLTTATVGQLEALTSDQTSFLTPDAIKGLTAAMVSVADNHLTAEAFGAINPLSLKTMLPATLAAIHTESFAGITPAQVAVLSTAQIKALDPLQIAKFDIDDAAALTPAQVAVFSAAQATALTTAAIANITPDAIAKLNLTTFDGTYNATPSADLAVLTNEQFQKLTASQIALITPAQAAVIMPSQIEGVKTLGSLANNNVTSSLSIPSLTTAVVTALETAQISKFDTAHLEAFTATQAASFNSDVADWAYSKGYTTIATREAVGTDAAGMGITSKGIDTDATVVAPTIKVDSTTAIPAGALGATITAGKNAVTITGTTRADKITGSPKDDTINPGADAAKVDTIDAGAGADTLNYAVADLIATNAITDSIVGGDGIDSIVATGAIIIDGTSTDGLKNAAEVEKLVAAANSIDTLAHSIILNSDTDLAGFTTIDLSLDTKSASSATVTLTGSTNNFTVVGVPAGINTLTSNAGNNNFTGGSAADIFNFGTGQLDSSDTVAGGTGSDKITLAGADSVDDADFANISGIEVLSLTGAGSSAILGAKALSAGITTVIGSADAQTITTGAGADIITGGAGSDVLDGGAGADTFIYNAVVGTTSDSVRVDGLNNADTGGDVITGFAFGTDTIKVAATNVANFIGAADSYNLYGSVHGGVSIGTATGTTYDGSVAGSFTNLTGLISFDSFTDVDFADSSDIAVTFATPTYSSGTALSTAVGTYSTNFLSSLVFDLTGTVASDGIWGGVGADTITGGAEADFLRGGRVFYSGDADLIFAGAATTANATTGIYPAGTDTIASTTVNSAFLNLMTPIGDTTHYDLLFKAANIIEGCQGDDILVASTAKDVFEYQTMTTGQGGVIANPGHDTIHSFQVGTDYIWTFESRGDGVEATGDFTFGTSAASTSAVPSTQHLTLPSAGGWSWLLDSSKNDAGTLTYTSANPSAGTSGTNANFSIHLVGLLGSGGTALATGVTADSFFL
jgi:hypothetical protein